MCKKMKKVTNKIDFKTFSRVFLIFLILTTTLFSVNFVSSFEFDNIKKYDSITKTVTIENAFGLGDDIAKIKLNTPLEYIVPTGYQKVAEFQVTNYKDYVNAFQKMDFYNLNRDSEKFDRQFDYKILSNVSYQSPIYDKEIKLVGYTTKYRMEWIPLSKYDFTAGEVLTVGVFTQVNIYDRVEWIPTFYGVEIREWASYIQKSGTTTFRDIGGVNYTVVTYTSNGFFNTTKSDGLNSTVLVVAGGGGGGAISGAYHCPGGGGAGGINYTQSFNISMENYVIQVGEGGHGGYENQTQGTEGTNSSFGNLIQTQGGGLGGGLYGSDTPATVGGSGGGGINAAGANGISGEGNNGGEGITNGGGGGGGKNAVGSNGDGTNGGAGGAGTGYTIYNGTLLYYGGGGGGGSRSGTAGAGGLGGGGAGATGQAGGSNAIANTGGGGGSTGCSVSDILDDGGDGGSGIVIIMYKTSDGEIETNVAPTVTLSLPLNNTNKTTISSTTFNATVFDDAKVQNVSLIIDGVVNETNATGINNTVYNFNKILAEGIYNWSIRAFDNESASTTTGIRIFEVHTTTPTLELTAPNGTSDFITVGNPVTLSWNLTEAGQNMSAHITNCSYTYNNVETFLPNITLCVETNTTTFNYVSGANNISFKAVDKFGFQTTQTNNFDYRIEKFNETFTTPVTEGSSTTFLAFIKTNGSDVTIGNLSYDSTENIATIQNTAGENWTLTKTITAPTVTANTNKTFFWNITQAGTFNYAFASQNQTVNNIAVDNCTNNTVVLYNFTIVNEETQVKLPVGNPNTTTNTTGKIDFNLYSSGRTASLTNYSALFNKTNPFSICLNSSFGGGESFNVDVALEYDADSYAKEFYHIQNALITVDDTNTNITLYDLLDTNSQEYKIIFKDSNFISVKDALIQIQRKYIDEGVFKTVEIPKTDTQGETIGHLVSNDIIYTFIVVKNGVTLGTFDNVRTNCQNPTIQTCTISLNSFASYITPEDFTTLDDFTYTLTYDNDTRTIESIFSIPSSTISTVLLNATLHDGLGTTSICSDTLTTSSGTLSCVVPHNVGNGTALIILSKDGVEQARGSIALAEFKQNYGLNVIFLNLILMLTLIGIGIGNNPIVTGFFLILGAILGLVLSLSNGAIGIGATVLWLIVAVVIVIIKGGKRT